jgi:hypothetical protein
MDAVRIALFPLGSAGDVHPFIGLGQALKRRGHDVAIMVNGYFRESVQRVGLEYLELGTADEFLAVTRDPGLWRPIRSFGSVFRLGIARSMREQYTAVTQHFLDRRTLLLANCLSFGVRIAAEKYRLPLVTIHIQPAPLWSEHQTPRLPYLPSSAPRWYKRAVFRIGQRLVVDRTVRPITNRFRAENGLPPMRHTIHWWNSPDGVLCRTGKTISVGFGLMVRNGVGSRFRGTINHMESGLPENDSRPLPRNATLIVLRTEKAVVAGEQQVAGATVLAHPFRGRLLLSPGPCPRSR